MGDYHFKAIYSKSYRSPSIMNIAYNTEIKPEETTIYEFEAGKQISDNLLLTANVFDVEICDPIVYFYGGTSNYTNFDRVGSRGIEFSGIYRKDTTNISLTYSYYKARDNEVTEYSVPGHNGLLLGFPAHKLTLLASVSPYKNVFVTPSLTYVSSRYAVTNYTTDYVHERLDPKLLTNVSLLFKDAFKKEGLDVSFSVYNIFDENYDFIEPYLGWYGPVPGPSREFVLGLRYRF
jgi:outer membrane receptor protein involved in Fe transport